jgi:peptidoglycan-associated lipoprotein
MIHRIAALSATMLLLAACSNPTVQEDAKVVYSIDAGEGDVLIIDAVPESLADLVGGDTVVHFAFDSSAISSEARAIIGQWADGLLAHPDLVVVVEGHCDERGTREYNLALGERRANAIRDVLVALGVDPARVGTISYGKERPAVSGHDPEAWAANRRGVLVEG